MNAFGCRYVVDTNVLSQLGRGRRDTNIFRENVVIPSEVLHEAQGFPDYSQLQGNHFATTPKVLELLVSVMATVPIGDTSLIDLYKNLGGADPLVIASALAGQEEDSQFLDAPEWVVVTGDGAVAAKAREFDLRVMDTDSFAALIDKTDGMPEHGRDTPAT